MRAAASAKSREIIDAFKPSRPRDTADNVVPRQAPTLLSVFQFSAAAALSVSTL